MSEHNETEGWRCSCGAVSSGSFCPSCGKKMPEKASLFCTKCGAELQSDARFCRACGAPTGVPNAAADPVSAQQPRQSHASGEPFDAQPQPKQKKKRRGCLISILAVIVLFIVLAIANGGEFRFSTANISEPAMASSVDPVSMKPVSKTDVFSPQSPIIYATALVKNAPSDTKISAKWIYVDAKIDIATVDVKTTQTNQYVAFNLTRPANGFPAGEYKVEIYLNDKLKETIKFTVKK